ncbi:MAG: protein translocase subunit SecD, partial [Candidatus Poribacteria bacterium]|nr:protein translocase subunit SecD [Candidatus Poribacteria bacterium]
MYQFSAWKLTLIIVVLVFAALYLIPTPDYFFNPLYGNLPPWMQERLSKFEATEDNSLKVSLNDVQFPEGINLHDAKTDLKDIFRVHLGKLGFVEETNYEFAGPESSDFIVKFLQEKSTADLQSVLEDLHLYGSLPTFVRRLVPSNRLKLGLDLKGGVRLVLEVDPEQSTAELLKERASSIPERLRADDILCKKVDVVADQESLNVFIVVKKKHRADVEQKAEYLNKARKLLDEMEYFDDATELSATDTQIVYEMRLSKDGIEKYSEGAIEQVLVVLRNRVDAFGVAEPSIRREANRPRIIVELPGAKDSSKPLQIVKTMGRLEFKLVEKNPNGGIYWSGSADTQPPEDIPEGTEISLHHDDGTSQANSWYVLKSPVLLTGDRITGAGPTQGATGFEIAVSMSFDSAGRRKFAEVTSNHVNEALAILLDGRVQSAPRIEEPIVGGQARITGDFTFEEANYLSNILKSGAFPVGVRIAEERTVGPTLGQESIDNGIKAALIGMGCVIIFMLVYYKLSGIVAIIALVFNMSI